MMNLLNCRSFVVFVANILAATVLSGWAFAETPISYNQQIRPLLSDRCFLCHGPDKSSREADLRLDASEFSYLVIEPGDVWASELAERISSNDPDYRMPPPSSGKTLTNEEITTIKRWIAEGAEYEPHWAFVTPKKVTPPETASKEWPAGAIDHFILAKMEQEGLSPSPEAEPVTLLRRVTLDLTGLPPTRDEVSDFLADDSPEAYERCVDRLLASPQYGEHMARYWLDAARYGDTHGLHLDNYREMWPYRDAVIQAMNKNMPWDQFVIKNLAGDLLPDASLEDQVLSGFNRCHVTTAEGGSIKEEVYTRNVVDRVSTTGTVFLGLTMGCAACHDHKFDPITSKDFYSSFAFFNNLDADPLDGNAAKYAPVVSLPSPEQTIQQKEFELILSKLTAQLDSPLPEFDEAQAVWETEWLNRSEEKWTVVEPTELNSSGGATLTKQEDGSVLVSGTNPAKDVHELVLATDKTNMVAIRLEALVDESLGGSMGRAVNGNAVLSEFTVDIKPLGGKEEKPQSLHFVSVAADHSQDKFPITNAVDGELGEQNGWAVEGHVHKESCSAIFVAEKPFGFEKGTELRVRLAYETEHSQHALGRVRLAVTSDPTVHPIAQGPWSMLGTFTHEDSKAAHDIDFGPEKQFDLKKTYLDGKVTWTPLPSLTDGQIFLVPREAGTTYLHRLIISPDSREMTISLGSNDGIKVWVNGVLHLESSVGRTVAADQNQITFRLEAGANNLLIKTTSYGAMAGFYYKDITELTLAKVMQLTRLLRIPEKERSKEGRKTVRDFFRSKNVPEWQELTKKRKEKQLAKTAFEESIPVSLVMRERAEPKDAFLLKRGEYDQPDKELGPLPRAVPAFLPPMPEGAPKNRLGYAQWLVDPSHPLMSRVTVNRFWQQCFGTGIVETSADFGAQGAWPSHPELLDWLAVEFRESGWNVKELMKLIVMSRTYRQSSKTNNDLIARDPANRLLSRGPRFRLDAEVLRDQALAVGGLLIDKIGGPSVKPPQPSGIWKAVAYTSSNTNKYVADTGPEKVHRRSLYTFWKRTAPPPEMSTLDAPSRESCVVRRERTNTPLQALLLLNDPQYIEAARMLAERAIVEKIRGPTPEIAATLFELATLRSPQAEELAVLVSVYEASRDRYRDDLNAAKKLIEVGETPRSPRLDPAEVAAWTLVANAVLNLDEVLTKE